MPFRSIQLCGRFLLVVMFLSSVSKATFADLNFSNFVPAVILAGDASIVSGRLRVAPAVDAQQGAAWFSIKQLVEDGFSTTFEFQLTDRAGSQDPSDGSVGADGFAFVIQNSAAATSAVGVLNNPAYDGIENSVAVEFDTYANSAVFGGTDFEDPNGNHVSVHTRGTLPNSLDERFSIGASTAIPDLSDDQVHSVKIRYVPGSMAIFMDDFNLPVLTVPLDLSSTLNLDNGRAFVGFTAGTGGGVQNHDILSWSFTEAPEPSTMTVFGLAFLGLTRCRQRNRISG